MRDVDVIVAGGGMAGLLTALTLARRGVHVVLVEPSRLGAGQSGQSHGYLHRGYAYGPDEPRLPALLASARQHWQGLLEEIRPVTDRSTVAFSEPAAVRRAERYWRESGLDVVPQPTPGWLTDTSVACFGSAEPTYNVGDILRGLGVQADAAGIEVCRGAVERVEQSGDGVRVRATGTDSGTQLLHARTAVLAAGAGTPGLLVRSRLPAVVQLRQALMLVLRGRLPAVSALFPGQEEHGLFLASRVAADGRSTWLVSDFQSFDSGGRDVGQLAGWWARRALLTLRRVVAAAVLARVDSVSGYTAIKSGLLPSSGTVAHEFGIQLLDGRVVVACPSKLTLAPLAARSTADVVAVRLGLRPGDGGWDPVTPVPPHRSTARESWETPMAALEHPDLLGELPRIGTLSELYRRVPA
ncbi:NAD(P)/FAD-dependent oxidoreductase [Cellulomonas xiejunii]|uniref:FAD-binding oxidoreductase n=1 Tax=Cellulomonas xiejunii TaxID=2968083 RepID=A0ABY5KMT3_9CELL|nr:FAD-dependent oxidoreductase [Cellulomonas xiejunii]MCC2321235.1 FAD-binding oxidoreductase [Cellulomonas xiejunii]UUI71822.1 FAD-binding oxidoreductase [Cellulomonas xiejunii]